jgi:hypothetical protein
MNHPFSGKFGSVDTCRTCGSVPNPGKCCKNERSCFQEDLGKGLASVDVRFGPFTCIAGPNAAGKSNLFDAIRFLSASASKTLIEAAMLVQNETARTWDVRSLFHRSGDRISDQMSFEVEIVVPKSAFDDLGQVARAKANFLRYSLVLRSRDRSPAENGFAGPLEILKEELVHIHSACRRPQRFPDFIKAFALAKPAAGGTVTDVPNRPAAVTPRCLMVPIRVPHKITPRHHVQQLGHLAI